MQDTADEHLNECIKDDQPSSFPWNWRVMKRGKSGDKILRWYENARSISLGNSRCISRLNAKQ